MVAIAEPATKGDARAVLQLAEQGVPVNNRDIRGTTPLWHAASQRHTDTVRVLLATNAVDVNAASVANRTPLFWPAAHGYVEVVKLLLNHGAQSDCIDVNGESPLTIAQFHGQTEVVSVLSGYNAWPTFEEAQKL